MSTNPFILANLQEGESCKEMVMGDIPLFTQDHYDVIKQLITESDTLTHIGTRIYFRKSTIDHVKVCTERNEPIDHGLEQSNFCDLTVMVRINREISPHLAACDVIEKIFTFVKPSLRFH